MTSPIFSFRSFEIEIWAKWHSSNFNVHELATIIFDSLKNAGMSIHELCLLQDLFMALCEVDFDSIYPNYLSHPLRVVGSLSLYPELLSLDITSLALCHNFREISENLNLASKLSDIEGSFLSNWSRQALDRLYTQRTLERDEFYLAKYYNEISGFGSALLLLKGLDKLDNHLSYAFESIDRFHHDVVLDFVIPRLDKVDPQLAFYLSRLVQYISEPDTVEQFTLKASKILY
jgi:hypothetical protein